MKSDPSPTCPQGPSATLQSLPNGIIAGPHRDWLLQRCRKADFTLRGLVAELAERGLKVDYRTVWEFVHAEKLSHKKKRGGWRTRSSRRRASASAMDKISRSRRA